MFLIFKQYNINYVIVIVKTVANGTLRLNYLILTFSYMEVTLTNKQHAIADASTYSPPMGCNMIKPYGFGMNFGR